MDQSDRGEQVKAMVDCILEFNPNLVITEKGISGASFCLCGVLITDCSPHVEQIMLSTSLPECLCTPTCMQVRPQPDRVGNRCRDHEPCRGPTRVMLKLRAHFELVQCSPLGHF